MIKDWQQRIAAARGDGQALQIRGGGSKEFYGQTPVGEVLDTRSYSGIVSYEPSELVVTARCGTPLAELEALLAEQRQMLAFEPPHFQSPDFQQPHFDGSGHGATVGGAVAAGLSGPRRARVGPVRDFVLGTQLLDGQGNLLNFGGQVMKNVAGYDVSRFLAGSMGILGIITEVSLKVLPLPEYELTLSLEMDQTAALNALCLWASKPLPISATCWHGGQLLVRLSGAESAVLAAAKTLGGQPLNASAGSMVWQQLKEQQGVFFTAGDLPLWRVALPATTPPLEFAAEQTLLEWNGTQRWVRTDATASDVRAEAERYGGHATLFRGGDKTAGVFTPLSAPLQQLHRNLKTQFDPAGIFNPGRLYPDL